MKRILFITLIILITILPTTFASTWVPYDNKDYNAAHPEAPVFYFDKGSIMIYEPENSSAPQGLFFWEKVVFPAGFDTKLKDIDFCLYMGRIDVDTLKYYTALVACHSTKRGMIFAPKARWNYRGNTEKEPLTTWIQQILQASKGNNITIIHEPIDLGSISESPIEVKAVKH